MVFWYTYLYMKSPENNFIKKVGRGVKNTLMGVTAAGLLAHAASQDKPVVDNKPTMSIESVDSVYAHFDPETRKELESLEKDYASMYLYDHTDAKEKGVTQIDLQNRFREVIGKYGQGLKIVFPESTHKTIADRAADAVFTKILRQDKEHAHYANSTLFYSNTPTDYEVTDKGDSAAVSSVRLENFVAEFSHHINNDFSLRRVAYYGEGFLRSGFHQQGMYGQTSSVEYQAHQVTEKALSAYFNADPEQLNIPFEKIRGSYEQFYEKIADKYKNELGDDEFYMINGQYIQQTKHHLDSLDQTQDWLLGRIDQLRAEVVEQAGKQENIAESFKGVITWEALQSALEGESLKDYVYGQNALNKVVREIKNKNFESIDQLTHDEVFLRNPDFIKFIDYSISGSALHSSKEKEYDEVLERFSHEESKNYIKHMLPFLETITDNLAKKYPNGEMSGGTFDVLRKEINRVLHVEKQFTHGEYNASLSETDQRIARLITRSSEVYNPRPPHAHHRAG